jgi:hypothetical protein
MRIAAGKRVFLPENAFLERRLLGSGAIRPDGVITLEAAQYSTRTKA